MNIEDAKVLIGDDSILARKQIKDAVSKLGITNIIEASNGKQALDLFEKEKPDLVFIDIVMPVMDGNIALECMLAQNPNAKVVVVSSVGSQGQLKRAVSAGVKDFIQKPIRADQIDKIVRTQLEES